MSSQKANDKSKAKPASRDRGQKRVAALKAAGAQVFAERGYDAATMTEVAARANSSIGSLYQFFPTKAALAEAIHQELIEAMAGIFAGLRAMSGRPAAIVTDALLGEFARFLAAHPEFVILVDRRDIPKAQKAQRGQYLRGEIAALLRTARPALPDEEIAVLGGLVLEVMKIIVAAAADESGLRNGVAEELRGMLMVRLGKNRKSG